MPFDNDEIAAKKIKIEGPVDDPLENGKPVEQYLTSKFEGIEFKLYTNDGKIHSNLALIALKNIFSKQLPKMPKEYIVRLVFDRRHYCLAITFENKIIGGICYRPYKEQRFAEIAFLAINGTEQVRGYGTLLMNHLKNFVQKQNIEYFLTYADNYAIGYFQKQGFSKTVAMPKDRWVGYIKDYDGGTLMECHIHDRVDYLRIPEIISKQRAFIYDRLRARTTGENEEDAVYSSSDIVYDGLELFKKGQRLKNVLEAPGVMSAGWKLQHLYNRIPGSVSVTSGSSSGISTSERDRDISQAKLASFLKSQFDRICNSKNSWPFKEAISRKEVPEYFDIISEPMDLHVIAARLKDGNYYRNKEMLYRDLMLMVDNCKLFNQEDSEYHLTAIKLQNEICELFPDVCAYMLHNDKAIEEAHSKSKSVE